MAPIHDAARDADVETLRRLLAEGVSPDATAGDFARTPLHVLCRNVENTTRHHAACFELLRDAGANLDATDSLGYTPLHYAASSKSVELVSLLVQARVNVDAATTAGTTALHLAARWGDPDCVEVLLAAGADIDVRSGGMRPFDLALEFNSRRMWPLFLRAGAEIPTDNTDPYIVRVKNAGGFKKYEQAHITRITAILAPTPRLPPEMVRKIVEFWLHAGYY